ncbi:MAG: hypothetical protein N2043_09605 [Ignavibacterium sp.]|nr:hypothetical protein [Ignavibacterium sp.]
MKSIFAIILLLLSFQINNFAQNEENQDELEIFLIDAYCKPDSNRILILTYYSGFPVKSKVILENKYEFKVSEELTELHKIRIDLSNLKFEDKQVEFVVKSIDSLGNEYTSEIFDFDLPYEPKVEGGSNIFTLCLFGGAVFLIPNPGLVVQNNKSEWSLTKEIPLLAFRKGYNYASSYISFELSYFNNFTDKFNYRLGYKRIWEVKSIEFISAGISGFSNFKNVSGFSPEITFGIFKLFESFTIYTRYRYSYILDSKNKFHELYLGFYSGFFTIYL